MPVLELTIEDRIAHLQFRRPKVFNALSPELLRAIVDTCDVIGRDDSVKLVILEGAGKHFSAGADLPLFLQAIESDPEGTADLGRRAAEAIKALPQITLAAIHGYCIGGALVMAASCDMRVAADDSRYSIPELDAGIPLSWGGMHDVVRLVGETVATDLVVTCRRFGADEALTSGFVSRVLPADQFGQSVRSIAEAIAGKPDIVLRQTKRKLLAIRAGTFDARHDAAEMLEALNDPQAARASRRYIERNIGR